MFNLIYILLLYRSCCLDGGSYAITLGEDNVCRDVGTGECSASNIPTSCPVKLDGVLKMHGCGVNERCCYPLDDAVPEYELSIDDSENICSENDYCPTGGSFSDDLASELAAISNVVDEDVHCYEECYLATDFDAVDGYLPIKLACTEDHKSLCDNSLKEYCLAFDVEMDAVIRKKDKSQSSKKEDLKLTLSYCGKLTDTVKPKQLCNRINNDFVSNYGSDARAIYELEEVKAECSGIVYCGKNCYNSEEGMEWWLILIIVLVIIFIIFFVVFLFFMFYKRWSVKPEDELIAIEEMDPRSMRLMEVERYVDEAIQHRDMAELKLAIDLVEEERFQEELDPKYREAVRLFNELVARSEREKADELRRAEEEAEATKRALEEAEKEVERRKREDDEAARRKSIKRRDAVRSKWMRLWPRLQILRALNAVSAEAAAKAMEEARKAREEEEKQRRLAEEKERTIRKCKKVLRDGLNTGTEEALSDALKNTDAMLFQTDILQENNELRSLYSKAKTELERLQKERERREKESERKQREGERLREERRRLALANLDGMKAALKTAIRQQDIDLLNKAIDAVESNALEGDMPDLYKQAVDLLARLQKIEAVKKNIMELKRPLIAELKSMSNPPEAVIRTMVATFLLLGEELGKVKDWNNIVILLNKTGKLSIKRRVQEFKVQSLSAAVAASAEKQIVGLTADEVYDANQAASLFYDWTEMISYESKQSRL